VQDFVNVRCGTPVDLGSTRAISQQAAGRSELSSFRDREHPILER
jgi:hypothetical protein